MARFRIGVEFLRLTADGRRVAWARGGGCAEIATMLDPAIIRVTGDLLQYLIDRRINLFVSKKISASFDLVDTAVPVNIQFERINGVMVVFGSGSHALLAARITVTVAAELGVPGGMFGPASY